MDKEELKIQLSEWRHYLHAHPESAFEEISGSNTSLLFPKSKAYACMWT